MVPETLQHTVGKPLERALQRCIVGLLNRRWSKVVRLAVGDPNQCPVYRTRTPDHTARDYLRFQGSAMHDLKALLVGFQTVCRSSLAVFILKILMRRRNGSLYMVFGISRPVTCRRTTFDHDRFQQPAMHR